MWDLSLVELLGFGFIGNKAFNVCSKAGLKSLYSINEYSKVKTFTEIESCGKTTESLLLSLCESYRRAVTLLTKSFDTAKVITFDTSLDDLLETERISLLTYKICYSAGVECVGDIKEQMNSHYVIRRCRLDIKRELIAICEEAENNRLLLSLRMSPNITSDSQASMDMSIKKPEGQLHKNIDIERLYELGLLSKRAYHCCKNAELYSLIEIINFRNKGLPHFYALQNCGRKTVDELCGLCDRYKSVLNDKKEDILSSSASIDSTDVKKVHSDSESAKEYFNIEYERLKGLLSVRGRHLCEATWSTYLDMLPFFNYSFESFSKRFVGKKKTTKELFEFLVKFKSIYFTHENHSEDDFVKLKNENLFPFLIERELDFAVSFRNEYGRYPMLYILTAYLSLSSDRTDSLYTYKYGISTGIPRSNDEVALAYHMTRERVRQIIQRYRLDSTLEFVSMSDWRYYITKAPLILTETSSMYREVAELENLQNGFSAFVGLMNSVVSYRKIRRKGENIYVQKEYEVKARYILDRITEIVETRYSRDTKVSVASIVDNDEISIAIAKSLLSSIFSIVVDEEGCFEVKQRRVDVSMEIIEILNIIGYPITLDEIFMLFKDKYPEHKYEDSSQIRPSINMSDEIVAIGKSGVYGLKKWNLFTGSVRDCAYMLLQSEEGPIPDAQLVERLLQYFPNSNYKSLMSSLMSDPKDRFAHYVDSTIWLSERTHLTSKVQVKARMSYENRLEDLKKFLFDYRRWPFASGGDDEASLARWIYNHTKRDLLPGYDPNEAKRIEQLQEEFSHYPHNNSEYEFQNTCTDFRIFLERNYTLPEEDSENMREKELAEWFHKVLSKKEPYDDNRQLYFNQLLEYLSEYGFSISI